MGLGAGKRPREIVQFFVDEAPRIFKRRSGLRHWFLRKYAADGLQASLGRCFGAKLTADSKKRLVIPTYNLGKDDVYLFKTPTTNDFGGTLEFHSNVASGSRHERGPDLLPVLHER